MQKWFFMAMLMVMATAVMAKPLLIEEFDYRSDYRAQSALLVDPDRVSQASLTYVNGAWAYQFWGSYDSHHQSHPYGNEIDIIISHTAPALAKRAVLSVGYAYYDFHPLRRTAGDLHAVFGSLTASRGKTRPFLAFEGDLPTARSVLSGGAYWQTGVIIALPDQLSGTVALYGNDGPFGFRPDPVSAAFFQLERPVRLSKTVLLVPALDFTQRLGRRRSQGGLATTGLGWWLKFSRTLVL